MHVFVSISILFHRSCSVPDPRFLEYALVDQVRLGMTSNGRLVGSSTQK